MHHVAMALAAQPEAGMNTQQCKYLWTACTNMSVNRNRGQELQWSTWGHYLQLNAGVTPLWFWADLFVLKIKRLASQMDQSGTLRCRIPGQPEEWLSIVWPSSRSAAVVCTLRHTGIDADLHRRTHRNNHNHKEPVSDQPVWPVDSVALLPVLGAPGLLTVCPFTC